MSPVPVGADTADSVEASAHDESELSDLTDDEMHVDADRDGAEPHSRNGRRKRSSTFIPSPMWDWATKKPVNPSENADADEDDPPPEEEKDVLDEDATDDEHDDGPHPLIGPVDAEHDDVDSGDSGEEDDEKAADDASDDDEEDEDVPDTATRLAQASIMASSQAVEEESADEEEEEEEKETPKQPTPEENKDPDVSLDVTEPDNEVELDLQPAHRAEALDGLARIELKFALLREAIYVEKMEGLAWEEALVHEGTHPELVHLQHELERRRNTRNALATRRSEYEIANIKKKRRIDEDIIWEWWKHGRDELQTDMIAETNRKRRRLERDRRIAERPPPKRLVPSCPLLVPFPPTIRQVVHKFPFEGNDVLDDEGSDTPPSPQNLVYPEIHIVPEDEIRQDLDRILNRTPLYEPLVYNGGPFGEAMPPMAYPVGPGGPPPTFEQIEWAQQQGRPPVAPTFQPHPGMLPPAPLPGMPPSNLISPPPAGPSNMTRLPHHSPGMFGPPSGTMYYGHESEMSTMVNIERPPHQPPPHHPPHMAFGHPPNRSPSPGPPDHLPKHSVPKNPWTTGPPFPSYPGGSKRDEWRDGPGFHPEHDRARSERDRRPRDEFEQRPPRDYNHPHQRPSHNGGSFPPTTQDASSHRHHHHVHHHHGPGSSINERPPTSNEGSKMHGNAPPSGPQWQERENDRDGRNKYGLGRPGPSPEAIPFALQPSNGNISRMPSEKSSSRNAWLDDGPFPKTNSSSLPAPPPNGPAFPERQGHSPTHRSNPSRDNNNYRPSSSRPIGTSPRSLPHPLDPAYPSNSPQTGSGNPSFSHRAQVNGSRKSPVHTNNNGPLPGPSSMYPSERLNGPNTSVDDRDRERERDHPPPSSMYPPIPLIEPASWSSRDRNDRDRGLPPPKPLKGGMMSVSSMLDGS